VKYHNLIGCSKTRTVGAQSVLNIWIPIWLFTLEFTRVQVKGSPYSITERRVPELIPILGSQPAGDVSHKPGSRLPLLSARPAVTPARGLLPILLLGEQRHSGCEQFA